MGRSVASVRQENVYQQLLQIYNLIFFSILGLINLIMPFLSTKNKISIKSGRIINFIFNSMSSNFFIVFPM